MVSKVKAVSEQRRYFWLFAVEVVANHEGGRVGVQINALHTTVNNRINSHDLGLVQQKAQIQFFTQHDPENKTKVMDVFIINVSHLGHMTPSEFNPPIPEEIPQEG